MKGIVAFLVAFAAWALLGLAVRLPAFTDWHFWVLMVALIAFSLSADIAACAREGRWPWQARQ